MDNNTTVGVSQGFCKDRTEKQEGPNHMQNETMMGRGKFLYRQVGAQDNHNFEAMI